MELKMYFKKMRETESAIKEEYPLIVSRTTDEGGKDGVVMEVSRENAAKAIVEGRALLASDEQKKAYLAEVAAKRRAFQKAEAARRLQISIVSEAETSAKALVKDDVPEGSR